MDGYAGNNNIGAETTSAENDTGERNERLGVRAFETQGRPTLDCRWDTLVYEEGLRSDLTGNQLGSPRLAIREESERLIMRKLVLN